jgi:hypothetical protein
MLTLGDPLGVAPHLHGERNRPLKKTVINHMNSMILQLNHIEECSKSKYLEPAQDRSGTDPTQLKHIVQI